MKGIREASMSKPTTPAQSSIYGYHPVKTSTQDIYDDFSEDEYGAYGGYRGGTSNYSPKYNSETEDTSITQDGQITMIFRFETEQVGECADETSMKYNEMEIEATASELAYDEIEKFAGKQYLERYTSSFAVDIGLFSIKVTATLLPVTKIS